MIKQTSWGAIPNISRIRSSHSRPGSSRRLSSPASCRNQPKHGGHPQLHRVDPAPKWLTVPVPGLIPCKIPVVRICTPMTSSMRDQWINWTARPISPPTTLKNGSSSSTSMKFFHQLYFEIISFLHFLSFGFVWLREEEHNYLQLMCDVTSEVLLRKLCTHGEMKEVIISQIKKSSGPFSVNITLLPDKLINKKLANWASCKAISTESKDAIPFFSKSNWKTK